MAPGEPAARPTSAKPNPSHMKGATGLTRHVLLSPTQSQVAEPKPSPSREGRFDLLGREGEPRA